VTGWTIETLAREIATCRISAVEATETCLARITRFDRRIRSFITLDADGARAAARGLDAELARGRSRGALHGIPVALKDLCHVRGLPTSCGTKTAEYFTPERECAAATRLRGAGAVILGKLNMVELAVGPFGDNPHHGDVQNPWRPGHSAGGSSSGSGAAVAAGFVLGALGSDTGGSIRMPAACCGIAGLKPTYGRVSRTGVMPLSWSLDHVGPMTRTVRDAALLLAVIAGRDASDATSSRRPVPDDLATLPRAIAGLRIGVPENYYFDRVDPEMEAAVRAAIRALEGLGAVLVDLRLPDPEPLVGVANVITRSESAAIHARLLRERPHEVGPVVRARLEIGFQISAHDYIQAQRVRSRLTREFIGEVFGTVDAIITPTIPEPAPKLETVTAGSLEEIVRRTGQFSRFTRPFNALGLPALSVPCGWSADGRPLAFQVVGRPFDEATVLRLGCAWELSAGASGRLLEPDLVD